VSGLSSEEKRARFQKALDYGGNTHTIADVMALVEAGNARFWEWRDGFIITEIHSFPRMKAGHYWLLSGCLRDVLALEHEVNPWLIEQGCTVATACGRKGWARAAAPIGWRPSPHLFNFHKTLVRSD
jgi:hypothetical protein